MPTTPRDRLEALFQNKLRDTPGNEVPVRKAQIEADIQCAIEIAEALLGLTVAVQSLEGNSVMVMNNLIKEIQAATKQAAESAKESGKMATESARLSGQLNTLTKWIVSAALLSALAGVIQAAVAVYSARIPPVVVQVAPAVASRRPRSQRSHRILYGPHTASLCAESVRQLAVPD